MGRLVLRRRTGESLSVGNNIHIEVLSAHGTGREICAIRFKVGEDVTVDVTKEGRHIKFLIEAPESTLILRDELIRRSDTTSASKEALESNRIAQHS